MYQISDEFHIIMQTANSCFDQIFSPRRLLSRIFFALKKMDVLNPELLWIGHRCYRVNIPIDSRDIEERPKASYEEEDDDCLIELEADEDFYEIQTIDGKFQLLIHVPQKFHSQIIGAKGSTKKRLEQGKSLIMFMDPLGLIIFYFRNVNTNNCT